MGEARRRRLLGLPPRNNNNQQKGNGAMEQFNDRLNVKLSDQPKVDCTCGNGVWVTSMELRGLSALVSPTGKPQIVQMPIGFTCAACGGFNTFQPTDELLNIIPTEFFKKAEEEMDEELPPICPKTD